MEMDEMLKELAMTVLTGALAIGAAYASLYFKRLGNKVQKEIAQIENEDQRELFSNAIEDCNTIAYKTVAAIEQTTAKALREAVKSGTANREDLVRLSQQAVSEIYRTMTKETMDVLQDNIGDLNTYLKNTVEEKLLEVKNQ